MKCPKCQAETAPGDRFCPACGTAVGGPAGAPAADATRSMPAPRGPLPAGSLVAGRYRVLGAAGEGGMGIVYKAEDTRLRRTVALKFLPAPLARDPEAKKRFLREAQAAAALDHPNICPVHEVDEDGGEMFLAMAFVEGRTLKDRIAEGPLPLAEALAIAVQVAEGLRAAHERGVVHRDVKPANIMLGRDGQVRVTDFGLASLEGGAELTAPQTVLGTPAYMSPEQTRGERTDGRTDVWSFGCTLYEMATGRRPFEGELAREVRARVLDQAPAEPAALRPEIPPGLVEVILRCLRKDSDGRFPDFEAVLAALRGEAVAGAGRRGAAAAPFREDMPSVAVLPFADMSPARDQDYFGEGLAEEIIHALAGARGLRVVARTSAFALKGLKLDVREIGRTLGVGAVLEGSVRKAGSRLRVTAQLIDAASGLHLWSERFDREERDVFDIQDEIARAIVGSLKVTLLGGAGAAARRRATDDMEAYNLYLKGLYFVARPNRESIDKALEAFRLALDRDPGFAAAEAGVGFAYTALGAINLAPQAEVFPKARAAAERALALDPGSALAHAVSATVRYYWDTDWAGAERSFLRVLELDPSQSVARGQYAWLLVTLRRFDEAAREIERALADDPLMPLLYAWSVGIHGAVGRPDRALEDFAKLLQIEPNIGLAYFHAAVAYLRKGLVAEAAETIRRGRPTLLSAGWGDEILVLCELAKGDRAGAERIQAETLEARKTLPVSAVTLALGFAALGDFDAAFEWLETGLRERDTIITVVHVYAEFMTPELARDPRFGAFLDRLGLPR